MFSADGRPCHHEVVEPTYRHTDIKPVCAFCSELAVSACQRCGRPVCSDHEAAPQARYQSCEGQFKTRDAVWDAVHTAAILVVPLGLAIGVCYWAPDSGLPDPLPALIAGALALGGPLLLTQLLIGPRR